MPSKPQHPPDTSKGKPKPDPKPSGPKTVSSRVFSDFAAI